MKFRPKEFVFPSVILHGSVLALLVLMCWKAPTLKTPREKQFRVSLVQLQRPAEKSVAAVPKKTTKPKPKPKKPPAPSPKPKPKTKPEPKPAPKKVVKPKPKPEPAKAKRRILPTPKTVLEKQSKWRKERERKKREKEKQARRIITNVPPRVAWKPEPQPRTVLPPSTPLRSKDAFAESQRRLAELERKLRSDRAAIRKRMESHLRADRFTAGASGAQAEIINDYFKRSILTAIDRVWIPPSAVLVPQVAQCDIAFRLRNNGSAGDVRVVRRSGFSALDDSAVAAVRQASFPPFPPDLSRETLDVEVPFVCEPRE